MEEVYTELTKQYTAAELAESFVFPSTLTRAERIEAGAELLRLRGERLAQMTDSEVMLSRLLRLRYRMAAYLMSNGYDKQYSFNRLLREYLQVTQRTQVELATEIGLDKTKLSKLLSGKLRPTVGLCFRLEKHSGSLISAKQWYKIYLKELERLVDTDQQLREEEYKQVTSKLTFGKAG